MVVNLDRELGLGQILRSTQASAKLNDRKKLRMEIQVPGINC